MTWESWSVQAECADCGRERYLTGGLCLDCSMSMGYTGEVTA